MLARKLRTALALSIVVATVALVAPKFATPTRRDGRDSLYRLEAGCQRAPGGINIRWFAGGNSVPVRPKESPCFGRRDDNRHTWERTVAYRLGSGGLGVIALVADKGNLDAGADCLIVRVEDAVTVAQDGTGVDGAATCAYDAR